MYHRAQPHHGYGERGERGRYDHRSQDQDRQRYPRNAHPYTGNVPQGGRRAPSVPHDPAPKRGFLDLRDHFPQCRREEGGCNGYHPGGARVCWFNPSHPKHRIGEVAFRGYVADVPIVVENHLPPGIPHVNPMVHSGDHLMYAIITKNAALQLQANVKNVQFSVQAHPKSRNLLVIDNKAPPPPPPPAVDDVIDEGLKQEKARIEKETTRMKFLLDLQQKKDELMKIQEQLKPASVEQMPRQAQVIAANEPAGNANPEPNDDPSPVPIPHIAANVGTWTRTISNANQSKWTKKLVDELIGSSLLQRKGLWFVFTTHYEKAACNEELQNALEWNTAEQVAKELRALRLAIQDVRDLHNPEINGLPAGNPHPRGH